MPIDKDALVRLRRYEDHSAGISEELLTPHLGGGRTVAALSRPLGRGSSTGWVICPSFGVEQIFLGRLEVEVARALAASGFPVLRYHGQGYGDSGNGAEAVGLSSHLSDAADAVALMAGQAGVERVGVLGARFGGMVAGLVAEQVDLPLMALWNPVITGRTYATELLRRRVLSDIARADGTASDVGTLREQLQKGGTVDLNGFPFTGTVYAEMCSADLMKDIRQFRGRCLILGISKTTVPDPALKTLAEHLRALGADVIVDAVQDPFAPDFGRFHYRADAKGEHKRDTQIDIRGAVRSRVVSWADSSAAQSPGSPAQAAASSPQALSDVPDGPAPSSPGFEEHPVFLPVESEFVAAVVTVPEGDPSGLVVLLTGLGAPRSHRFQMWTKVARRLAARGIASMRLDYGGMGDSTGAALEWKDGWERTLLPQVLSTTKQQMRILGVDRVAAVGNCGGAWLSLLLAAEMPESSGAMCLLPGLMEATSVTGIYRRIRWSKLAQWTRSVRVLRRVIVRTVRGRRPEWRLNRALPPLLRRTLNRVPLLFLYGDRDLEYSPRGAAALLRLVETLPNDHQARFELCVIPDTELEGFERLDVQELVVETATEWLSACLGFHQTEALRVDGANALSNRGRLSRTPPVLWR